MAAKGWLKKVTTFRFVASFLMLSDVLPVLARLSKTFQARCIVFPDIEPPLTAAQTSLDQLHEDDSEYQLFS